MLNTNHPYAYESLSASKGSRNNDGTYFFFNADAWRQTFTAPLDATYGAGTLYEVAVFRGGTHHALHLLCFSLLAALSLRVGLLAALSLRVGLLAALSLRVGL